MILLGNLSRFLFGREKPPPAKVQEVFALEKFIEAFPLPAALVNSRFLLLKTNHPLRRLFQLKTVGLEGLSLGRIIGQSPSLVSDDGNRERPVRLSELARLPNPKTIRGPFPRIGHHVFSVFTESLSLGRARASLFVFEERTLDHRREEAIAKSRSELLSIFDATRDPTVLIDPEYRIRRINRSMLSVMGRNSYKEFIGKPCYQKLHGLKGRCPGCTAGQTFTSGEETVRNGLLSGRKEAENFPYEIACVPIKDANGRVTGIAESYRDLTHVTRLQEELYESERNRVVIPLAAGVAHEIRNPLAVIRSTAQYSMEKGVSPDEVRENLGVILQNTDRANRVIGELLDFARPQRVDFKHQPLKAVLEEGVRLIKPRAARQKVAVSLSVPDRLPRLVLDKHRFLQAWFNLLVNSLDAMPRGGRMEVSVGLDRKAEEVTVTLADTGVGVPEEMVSRIFQPFFTTRKEGVGLGLPIADGIIRSHGGKIMFKSRAPRGTEVSILLPLHGKPP